MRSYWDVHFPEDLEVKSIDGVFMIWATQSNNQSMHYTVKFRNNAHPK